MASAAAVASSSKEAFAIDNPVKSVIMVLVKYINIAIKTTGYTSRYLEIKQWLQTTLGNLSLVRGIGSVPARILENISLDNRRENGIVISHSNEWSQHLLQVNGFFFPI